MLSDEQKQSLSATAKGRSRNSRGQFVDTVTAQEARIAEMEAKSKADDESIAWFYKENGRLEARIVSDRIAFIAVAIFTAVIANFIVRWAR